MNIIFLDCDGVVNSQNWMLKTSPQNFIRSSKDYDWHRDFIDPATIQVLNKLVDESNVKFVLSSTWRKNTELDIICDAFTYHNFKGEIIDKTPVDMKCRGAEIEYWLKNTLLPINSFAILDDDSDLDPFMRRLVKTNYLYGLEAAHIEKIKKVLDIPYNL